MSIYLSTGPKTEYYVYAYLREQDSEVGKAGTTYYIGKGKGDRAYSHRNRRVSVPKDKSRIVFLERNLTNIGALALERRMIKWYGRVDVGTGILRNRTDGGEGFPDKPWNTGIPVTEQHKKYLSKVLSGRPRPSSSRPGKLNTFYGKKHSAETLHLQREAKLGEKNGMFGRKQKRKHCPHCNKDIPINTYSRFHGDNCKSYLNLPIVNTP